MFISDNLKQRLYKSTRNDLRSLAVQHNNLEAFEALDVQENFELSSSLLGLEDKYQEYLKIVFDPNQTLAPNAVDLIEAYHHFLMANICFPGEFEN